MSNVGKIRLKSIVELQATINTSEGVDKSVQQSVDVGEKTPKKKTPGKITTGNTGKTKSEVIQQDTLIIANATITKRSSKKATPLPGQMRIDSFFKSSTKSFKVERLRTDASAKGKIPKASKKKLPQKSHKGRKRLFDEEGTTSTTSTSVSNMEPLTKRIQPPRKARGKENTNKTEANVIDLCSESDEDSDAMKSIKLEPPPDKIPKVLRIMNEPCPPSPLVNDPCPSSPMVSIPSEIILGDISIKENLLSQPSPTAATIVPHESPRSDASLKLIEGTSLEGNLSPVATINEITGAAPVSGTRSSKMSNEIAAIDAPLPVPTETGNARKKRTPKPCPPYKVVEGTHFCVDGFQFGAIPGVTHYFLTHYHADHYIGLTKKFAFPLFMSPTTARLVRAFIKLDETYIHEIDVDETIVVDDIAVTGIEANHCPGALMFFFRLSSGECILHTGDFRASFEMESLPIFWNNIDIDLLYLDTTYLSANYDFCHQAESVERALYLVKEFHERHPAKRILYVCGSYVIGKEKIWLALANEFSLNVWTEPHRRVAFDCLDWPDLQTRLTDDPHKANLHVLAMGKVSYLFLAEYFKDFEEQYDVLLAIRPSGWEKNSKPSYGKRISTIGVEYSEHSSYKELERFVRFIKPKRVISTVPVGHDLFVTGKVPAKWYQFKGRLSRMTRGYQPSIFTFMATPKRNIPHTRYQRSETEMALSPVDDRESGEEDHVTISSGTSENELTRNETEAQADGDASEVATLKSESPDKSKPSTGEVAIINRLTSDASDDWLADL